LCFGGQGIISVSQTGDVAGTFTYTCTPTASGTEVILKTTATTAELSVDPGTYTCTVKSDATGNCSATVSNIVVSAPASAVSLSQVGTTTNVGCHGASTGAFSLIATGGTGTGYTYVCTPSVVFINSGTSMDATNLVGGTYVCGALDSNSCASNTLSITVVDPPALVASVVSQNDPTCNGFTDGTFTLSSTGGTGAVSFSCVPSVSFSSGVATGAGAKPYACTATDATSCTSAVTVTLGQPAVLTLAKGTVTSASCFGGQDGSVVLTAGNTFVCFLFFSFFN
jgi:hypothetical protein